MARPHDPNDGLPTQGAPDGEAEGTRILVVVVDGETRSIELPEDGAVLVGRGPRARVAIERPWISRKHLVLHCSPAGVDAEDLGGATGTRRGANRLPAGKRVALRPGDSLRLGAASITYLAPETSGPRPGGSADAPIVAGAQLRAVYALVERVAQGRINVLVLGETGVGKERIAEALHARSPRAAGPLVRLNCASFAESLLESELFGYERGAFTGAAAAKAGLIESADGGTVFLDEIGEMPLTLQAKLLRVLEERQVRRVGALKPVAIDVRFVAATHRDLAAESAAGRFREDLFFRLRGVIIRVPPLRERVEEIPSLAAAFLREASDGAGHELSPGALVALQRHPWPGNVRELKQVIERACLLAEGRAIDVPDLGFDEEKRATGRQPSDTSRASREPRPAPNDASALREQLGALEREHILATLESCAGNQSRAARALGISRNTLMKKLDAYEVARPRKPRSE